MNLRNLTTELKIPKSLNIIRYPRIQNLLLDPIEIDKMMQAIYIFTEYYKSIGFDIIWF